MKMETWLGMSLELSPSLVLQRQSQVDLMPVLVRVLVLLGPVTVPAAAPRGPLPCTS